MKLVWYALGGGLGHLQRALAVLRWLRPKLGADAPLLLTSSAYAHLAMAEGLPCLRLPGAHEAQALPPGAVATAIRALLDALAPQCLVVDTFPDGLHGELAADWLARVPQRYLLARPGGGDPASSPAWPLYHQVFVPLPHSPWPGAEPIGWVLTRRPGEALSSADARRRLGLSPVADRPLVMALHAGDPGEVVALFESLRAASARLTQPHDLRLATPLPLGGWLLDDRLVHPWPAAELFPAVDLLVSGGGYHTTAEAAAFGVRALQLAFRRSHDDQAARLAPEASEEEPLATPLPFRAEAHWDVARWEAALQAALAAPRPTPLPAQETDGARQLALKLLERLA
ncbi:MAG: hypothetical protein VKP62_11980 [Candidatus Sericytochromatia bacterium]|nr:hypothetical protein [Candidatus Sericytochromatia bacterium]